MFSESEANALITVEQVVFNNSDRSLIAEYLQAKDKVKAVLLYSTKDKVDFLSKRIAIKSYFFLKNRWNFLVKFNIIYQSGAEGEKTEREIEPFAFYYTLEG